MFERFDLTSKSGTSVIRDENVKSVLHRALVDLNTFCLAVSHLSFIQLRSSFSVTLQRHTNVPVSLIQWTRGRPTTNLGLFSDGSNRCEGGGGMSSSFSFEIDLNGASSNLERICWHPFILVTICRLCFLSNSSGIKRNELSQIRSPAR